MEWKKSYYLFIFETVSLEPVRAEGGGRRAWLMLLNV